MNRMNKDKKIDSNTVVATTDIGKSIHWGYLRCSVNEQKAFKFSNNKEGFDKFWFKIEEFMRANNLDKVVFGFESTGSYGDPLKFYMQQKGASLIQVNPMHTKRLKELSDNSPNKTDKKDPRVIADILMLGYGLTSIIPKGKIAELRELVLSRESKLEDINRIKNRIEALLARHFPEFLQIMGLRSKTSMYLVKHYTTAESISRIDEKQLTAEIFKISRGQIKQARSEKLYQAALNTVGIREGQNAYKQTVGMFIQEIELLQLQLSEVEKMMKAIVEQLPESRILQSVKGIGFITTVYLLSEVVNFKAYKVQKEIEKFAGVNIYEISSGKHKGKRKLSKRGRTLLRKTLFLAALNMVRKGGIYYEDYHRYLNRGVKKIEALVIVMKRLLRMVFALVRKNEMFIENYKLAA